jgi:hypothetical protein
MGKVLITARIVDAFSLLARLLTSLMLILLAVMPDLSVINLIPADSVIASYISTS